MHRMTDMCLGLYILLSSYHKTYGKGIHRPVGDIPEEESGEHVLGHPHSSPLSSSSRREVENLYCTPCMSWLRSCAVPFRSRLFMYQQ